MHKHPDSQPSNTTAAPHFPLGENVARTSMSSQEIAERVGSRHDKVKQSIARQAERGTIQRPPLGEVKHHTSGVIVQPPMGDEQSSDPLGLPRIGKVSKTTRGANPRLSKEQRTEINRVAHAAAQEFYRRVRDQLIKEATAGLAVKTALGR